MYTIFGSSRKGNSEWLGEQALKGIPHVAVDLANVSIQPIEDRRHHGGFLPIGDDYRRIVEEMLEHDDILFITPIYWYSMSTKMKLFIDRFSESLRDEELDFKSRMAGKRFHLIAVGGDDPRLKGQALVTQFKHIASFLGATLETAILAEGNAPGEVEYDQEAVAAIAAFREKMSGARV